MFKVRERTLSFLKMLVLVIKRVEVRRYILLGFQFDMPAKGPEGGIPIRSSDLLKPTSF